MYVPLIRTIQFVMLYIIKIIYRTHIFIHVSIKYTYNVLTNPKNIKLIFIVSYVEEKQKEIV